LEAEKGEMTGNPKNKRSHGGFAGLVVWMLGGTAVGLIEMHVAAASPDVDFSGYSLLSFMLYYWIPALAGGLLVWAGLGAMSRITGRSIDGFAFSFGAFSAAVSVVYLGLWVNHRISARLREWPSIAAILVVVLFSVLVGLLMGRIARSAAKRLEGRRAIKGALLVVVAAPIIYLAWSWGNTEGYRRMGQAASEPGASVAGVAAGGIESEGAPNVILITIDALRASHLTVNGYGRNTSPYIDRLASEGANFSCALSQATVTVRSMASVFTSLYPEMHGLMTWGLRLPKSVQTLPEALAMRGYSTAGFGGGNPSLSQTAGIVRGFDHYDDCRRIDQLAPMEVLSRLGLLTRVSSKWNATCPPGQVVFKKARAWLRTSPPRPFFLFMHLMDVHAPYLPPKPFVSKFSKSVEGAASDVELNARLNAIARKESPLFFELFERGEFSRMGELNLTPEDVGKANLQRLIDLYDAEISYADSQIGAFVEDLSASGVLDRTLVIITADHGEGFLDHGRLFHSGDLVYDELMRVPLIMRYPRVIQPGTCIDAPVRLIDVMPTVLEIAEAGGAREPSGGPKPEMKGRSLLGLFLGDERELMARENGDVYCEGAFVACVRTSRWKYIDSKGHDSIELYDLMADPGEKVNLIAQMDEQAQRMASILEGYAEQVRQYTESHQGPTPIAVSDDTRKRLRSLGYVQ
jgi:arylsulfatase A-like enzyme